MSTPHLIPASVSIPKLKEEETFFFWSASFELGQKKQNCKYDVYFSHVGEIAKICCQRHTRSYKNGHVATLHVWLHFLCHESFHMKKFNPCFTIPSGTIASIKDVMKPCHSMVMVRKPDIRAQQFLKLQFLVWSITGWRLSRFGGSTYLRQGLLQLLTGWNERFCSKHSMSGHVSIIFQFRKSYDVWASRDVMKNSMYSLPTTPQDVRTNTYQNRKRNRKITEMRFHELQFWSSTHQHTLQITKPIKMFKASAWFSIIITLHLNPNAHLFTQFLTWHTRANTHTRATTNWNHTLFPNRTNISSKYWPAASSGKLMPFDGLKVRPPHCHYKMMAQKHENWDNESNGNHDKISAKFAISIPPTQRPTWTNNDCSV